MAAHNSSPMPGVHPNPDPALDIAREHEHQHLHHSAHAAHVDNSTPVYTTGTTDEKVSKLFQPSAQDSSHLQHRHVAGDDIEKNGTFANYDEKATRSSSDPENEIEVEKKKWYSPSVLYRKFRLPIHIWLGCFFTG
jgi:CNT family concentrative nucleoside transporter